MPKTFGPQCEREMKRNLRVCDNDNYVRKGVGKDGKDDENNNQ
jgi:hypothetical protein